MNSVNLVGRLIRDPVERSRTPNDVAVCELRLAQRQNRSWRWSSGAGRRSGTPGAR
jgi:single-stranded DNA-binding protein